MRKFPSTLAILALLCTSVTTSVAASVPKVGAKCAKAGQTQTVDGKKYTCIKSGSKLTWNIGVVVPVRVSPGESARSEDSNSHAEATPGASAESSPSTAPVLIKFRNCTEAKAAGAAPLTKTKTPELYEFNAGLDRDKDGIACEN